MPSGRPPSKEGAPPSTARTVHIEDSAWERIMRVAFETKPRRSASDIVREMIDRELPKYEADLKQAS